MRELKDSGVKWIGDAPIDWEIVPVKADVVIGHGSDPVLPGDIPVWGSGNEPFKTCGEYKEGPVVLLGRKGTLDCPQLIAGRYWNVDTAFDAKINSGNLKLKFFYYAATCIDIKPYATNTAKPSMTQFDWANSKIPRPPLSEQRRIIEFLDERCKAIDADIAKRREVIEKLGEYKKSVIARVVTKGLGSDAEMKDSGVMWIGEVPTGWTVAKLSYFASSVLGKMIDRKQETSSNVHRYLSNRDVGWFSINVDNLSETSFPKNSDDRYGIEDGDVLICEGGEVGKCCVWRGPSPDFYFQKAIHRLRVDEKTAVPEYIAYQMLQKSTEGNFMEVRRGEATISHLPGDQLMMLKFILPPLDEQQEIVSYLDNRRAHIDEAVTRQEQLIAKLEEYRKSLIYHAVTGKIDCREEANAR